ncbi:non-canonical ubiquitin conjugating enzyme, putative, partial [Perkinsus marinus ATCC 50983]
ANSVFEWHYMWAAGTVFQGGRYHGRIVLPSKYPFGPRVVMLLTSNGRFEVNENIYLSISSYHPGRWQPALGIRTDGSSQKLHADPWRRSHRGVGLAWGDSSAVGDGKSI